MEYSNIGTSRYTPKCVLTYLYMKQEETVQNKTATLL